MTSRRFQGGPLPWFEFSDLLVLLAWGSLLLKYWLTGELAVLLHPDYQWLSHSAAVVLLGLAGLQGWRLLTQMLQPPSRRPALAQHITLMPHRWSRGILLAVAVAGLIYSPRPFTSDTALQRGLTDTLSMTRSSRPQAFVRQAAPEERTIIDWVRTLNVYPEPDAYGGQAVDVIGFVIHPPEWPDSHLMIARFVLTCCAADAYPVGLAVRLPTGQALPAADTWLRVTGQMTTETLDGQRQLVVAPDRLRPVEEPANPYEY
ncbi:hypothetical protein XM38_022660 [Halomicronema hongdechloris C2206]|uniref:DUF1980 domain-containing protein n=2 Tax=Halomicronema hongdechloris TaxID=1209493 RepID=A0A1Z3HLZ3_9CYAN|nr:hypothetical protein XM38_022660 [Halomicronema hongdechloris C2206]